nr:unnamed protein product [Digitaria exilis]
MVAAQGKEAVGIALLFSFAFICARFLLDSLVYKQDEFPTTLYYIFNTMLLTLLVFHVYWGKLIYSEDDE